MDVRNFVTHMLRLLLFLLLCVKRGERPPFLNMLHTSRRRGRRLFFGHSAGQSPFGKDLGATTNLARGSLALCALPFTSTFVPELPVK